MPKTFRTLTMKFNVCEPEIKKYLEKFLEVAEVFIDIGAAHGYYTLKAVKNALVLAFEPDSLAYRILQANMAINNIHNVKSYNIALDDEDGEALIGGATVKARKLDSILKEEGIELSTDDVIKMDVEGMALNVLGGMLQTLRNSKPKIIIELHPGEEAVEDFLKGLGYNTEKPSKYFVVAGCG